MDSHSSRHAVTDALKRPTRTSWRRATSRDAPIWPCSQRGLPGRSGCPDRRCALTAPFHLHQQVKDPLHLRHRHIRSGARCELRPKSHLPAACFLWHFPSTSADRELPGAVPCGARTFLPPLPKETTGDCLDCRSRPQDRAALSRELQANMRSFALCKTNYGSW